MKGIAISKGYAVGSVVYYDNKMPLVDHIKVSDTEGEIKRLKATFTALKEKIGLKHDLAASKQENEKKDIFQAHLMMLEDPELVGQMKDMVLNEGCNAEYAVLGVCDQFVALFEAMENDYLRQRASDIKDLRDQLLKDLMGIEDRRAYPKNTIVCARDFNPSDIHLTEDPHVVGLLAEEGADTSHFAILARISGIPTVLNVNGLLDQLKSGDRVVVDGYKGEVLVNPSQEVLGHYQDLKGFQRAYDEKLNHFTKGQTLTQDGHQVSLFANIANVKDMQMSLEKGAEGVGLFRTEFIYMDRNKAPSEEEQFAVYKQVLEGMQGKPVVIRTLDVGGDKALDYLGIPKEENPFLGFRAVRYCLTNLPLFKTQLRALLRASIYGSLSIMVPMISTLEEVIAVKKLLKGVEGDLRQAGISFGSYQVGIMIEVPSAAIMSDVLAKEVDFFSIGTNDLIQYTMAADRMNKAVAYLYSPAIPSVVRLIHSVIKNANGAGIHAAMCGELASKPRFIPLLVGMGLNEFSMSPSAIPEARYVVSLLKRSACEKLVEEVLKQGSEEGVKTLIETFYDTYLKSALTIST